MALTITDPEALRLADEIAAATGESLPVVVVRSLRERLERLQQPHGPTLADQLLAISESCANLPLRDAGSVSDILGYDGTGLPN